MKTSPVRLVLSWALVAVLLGYGVIQTGITAAKLFQQGARDGRCRGPGRCLSVRMPHLPGGASVRRGMSSRH